MIFIVQDLYIFKGMFDVELDSGRNGGNIAAANAPKAP